MSDVSALRDSLVGIAGEAKGAADGMAHFKGKFNKHIDEVNKLIATTATKADQHIISLLQDASRAVEAAEAALNTAAGEARKYGGQI